MKKVIKGKRYDTDAAKSIGSWEENLPNDLFYTSETLYRKKTGEFFLHCCGGGKTRFARPVEGGGWTGGEEIIPLSEESAKEWAEENLDADEYESAFDVQEGRVIRSVSLTERAAEKAEADAEENGLNFSAYIEKLIMKGGK